MLTNKVIRTAAVLCSLNSVLYHPIRVITLTKFLTPHGSCILYSVF